MSYKYINPISTQIVPDTWSVTNTTVKGTNFSVFNVGGYMEVWSLSDLNFTDGGAASGPITYSGNVIPVEYTKSPNSNFIANTLTLEGDGISSGRRRLGMLVYVHETQLTYQYVVPDYETLFNNAESEGSIQSNIDGNTGQIISYTVKDRLNPSTPWPNGGALISAWLDSSIEGVNGVTRNNARWRVFWGTDWQVTGGTVNYNSTGDLNLNSNSGNTVTISGLKTITGGTYFSGTSTLELYNNLGDTVSVTGFTTGGGDVSVSANTGLGIIGDNTLFTIYNSQLSPTLEMGETVGGIEAGTAVSDLSGKTLVQMFNDLLFPTVLPTYVQPTIALNGLNSKTKEVGSTEAINVTAYSVKNDAGDYTNLRIRTGTTSADVEVVVDNSPSPSATTDLSPQFGFANPNNPNSAFTSTSLTYTLTVPAPTVGTSSTVRYDSIGDYGNGLPIKDNKGDDTTTSPISSGTNNSTDRVITGIYPYFWGVSTTEPTPTTIANDISNGNANKVLSQANGTITITFDANEEYLWFAHLSSYSTKTTWYVAEGNEGNIGTGSDLFGAVATTSVDSPETYWTGINFKVYVSNYPTTTSGGMQLRN